MDNILFGKYLTNFFNRKQREEEMKRFRKHSTDDVVPRKNQYYDDVFDAPE